MSQPPAWSAPGYPPDPGQWGQPPGYRPEPTSGFLLAGGVIQILQSLAWVALSIILIVFAASARDAVNDLGEFAPLGNTALNTYITVGVILLVTAVTMAVLAGVTLRYVDGCRIAGAITQIIFALIWVILVIGSVADEDSSDGSGVVVGTLFLVSCVCAAVFLLHPSARAACLARRHQRWTPPGRYGQPWPGPPV